MKRFKVAKAVFVIGVLLIIIGMFGFYRNSWVYSKRTDILFNNFQEYEKLWSYDKMLNHFWIWDIDKMKKVEKTN